MDNPGSCGAACGATPSVQTPPSWPPGGQHGCAVVGGQRSAGTRRGPGDVCPHAEPLAHAPRLLAPTAVPPRATCRRKLRRCVRQRGRSGRKETLPMAQRLQQPQMLASSAGGCLLPGASPEFEVPELEPGNGNSRPACRVSGGCAAARSVTLLTSTLLQSSASARKRRMLLSLRPEKAPVSGHVDCLVARGERAAALVRQCALRDPAHSVPVPDRVLEHQPNLHLTCGLPSP